MGVTPKALEDNVFHKTDNSTRPTSNSRRFLAFCTHTILPRFFGAWLLISFAFAFYYLATGSYPAAPWSYSSQSESAVSSSNSRPPPLLVEAKHGAVATENERCSNIGVKILKEGGNAVDAAIGATFCIGVVNMFSSGIGGGGFMIVRIPPSSPNGSSKVYTIDFREAAPALSNATMYKGDPLSSKFGGLSVAVPGELRGLAEAHARWGTLPWKRLVEPSVNLARGWKVDIELGKRIPWFSQLMLNHPDWRAIFAPHRRFLCAGDRIQRTQYANTLDAIATGGADVFYHGHIADSLVEKVRATGGILTHEDLEKYTVKVRPALRSTYRNRTVYTTHPPTSGPVLLHMLNLVERYDFVHEGRTSLNVHRLVEAMKFGFSARTRVSDPDFNNSGSYLDRLPTKQFSDVVAANLTDDRTHPPEFYQPEFGFHDDHGTSHTSVIDRHGMAVALTSSVNLVFGSEVMDPETGVIFNDEMDDFSTPDTPNAFGLMPSPYNFAAPLKRPLSSMAPTIIEHPDGSFYLAIGGSGGSRIFPSVFQVVLNLDWGQDIGQAIEHGRLHDQLYPLHLEVDDNIPDEEAEYLKQRGHNVTTSDRLTAGIVQAVLRKDGKIFAASDARKNGIAAGY